VTGKTTTESARERYERALERLKQAALELRQAQRRGIGDLAAYRADVDRAKRALEAVVTELPADLDGKLR
jgi:hypothetical protein